MEQLQVFCRSSCQGKATVERNDSRAEINVSMKDPADGLYRAVLTGERGTLPLGVLEPHHGTLLLRRRPYLRDIECLGMLKDVQVSRSFAFHRSDIWKVTDHASDLVHSPFLKKRLEQYPTIRWKKTGDSLCLALPLREDAPFPLDALFCFARIESVEGKRCVVYTFDKDEKPI